MERSNYPFPLAVHSSHHSHYHRFLLGADPAVLAPFPKPCCLGALRSSLPGLADNLNLPRWRKLYHASIPWIPGYGPDHYELGNVAPQRPLPRGYGRPVRKFGAYDFVQVADPSLSALALVAGDRRVVERFVALSGDFCSRVESGISSRATGPSGSRRTGRMLAGQFAEPNNRWLLPFLHVHSRVLNFTSFSETPGRLDCIDPGSLSRAGRKAKENWIARQAGLLRDLGYGADVGGESHARLRVDGVCPRLVATIEAPRIAVLRILERALVGDRPPSAERLCGELPTAVIAAMAERLEALLARSLSFYKPAKLELPSEGPWRSAVREHLSHYCPGSLEQLDRCALRAKADIFHTALFPVPALDPAHFHAPCIEALGEASQMPSDPELGVTPAQERPGVRASRRLALEFAATLGEVNERIVIAGPRDPLVSLGGILPGIDQLAEGADWEQLGQSERLLDAEVEARERHAAESMGDGRAAPSHRVALASLEDLFEDAAVPRVACEQEMGGRSL